MTKKNEQLDQKEKDKVSEDQIIENQETDSVDSIEEGTEENKETAKKFLKFRAKKKAKEEAPTDKWGQKVKVKEEVSPIEEKAEPPKAASSEYTAGNSKMGMLSYMTNAMSSMSKSDMEKFFEKMMSEFGNYGQKDNSAKNRDSVKMAGGPTSAKNAAIKEDIEELFSDETLSEEFKEKATTLFEAVVSTYIAEMRVEMEEAYEAKLEEEVANIAIEMQEQVEDHLNYVTEKWYEENEVAIESQVRTDRMESFFVGLRDLFVEHNINIPDEAVDVVEELTLANEELTDKVNEVLNENIKLKKAIQEVDKATVFHTVAEGLNVTQSEKFAKLSESVDYNGNQEDYEKKLNVIKDFVLKDKKKIEESSKEPSGVEMLSETVDTSVKRYTEALSRTLKK